MRSPADRIRHSVAFEILGILLATPFTALVFHLPGESSTVIVVVSALVAMAWNYLYNLVFDHALKALHRSTDKSVPMRVLHAVLFELGLTALLLPFVALYLGIGLIEALVMDIALALFYVVYAFVFNWGYDRVFPLPEWQAPKADGGPAKAR
jgi:uncharacterized membrane protein